MTCLHMSACHCRVRLVGCDAVDATRLAREVMPSFPRAVFDVGPAPITDARTGVSNADADDSVGNEDDDMRPAGRPAGAGWRTDGDSGVDHRTWNLPSAY